MPIGLFRSDHPHHLAAHELLAAVGELNGQLDGGVERGRLVGADEQPALADVGDVLVEERGQAAEANPERGGEARMATMTARLGLYSSALRDIATT